MKTWHVQSILSCNYYNYHIPTHNHPYKYIIMFQYIKYSPLNDSCGDYIRHMLMTLSIFRSSHIHTPPPCNYCKYDNPRQRHPYK